MKRLIAAAAALAVLASLVGCGAESVEPAETETVIATAAPTTEPTSAPTAEPEETAEPTVEPTAEPTTVPTAEPTAEPAPAPTVEPTAEPTPETVDLLAFYQSIEEEYGLNGQMALEGDYLDGFFPGLADIETVQLVAYTSMIGSVVSEFVFVQCADSADTETVAAILQARADTQAEGGAWYPASMADWEKTVVLTGEGGFAAMIALGDDSDAVAEKYLALFE
ncbi:MAG: DUF4358 domain-containing protein [Oscillospiraceae bacterium]|nr:DUF4358 domain-containing protein [Oscillospiraceae bacterium]